jgi:hypothetical protein
MLHTHKPALLNHFNRGRQPASLNWCPTNWAGLTLVTCISYPIESTCHPLPLILRPHNLNRTNTLLVTLLLTPTSALYHNTVCFANKSKTLHRVSTALTFFNCTHCSLGRQEQEYFAEHKEVSLVYFSTYEPTNMPPNTVMQRATMTVPYDATSSSYCPAYTAVR